MSAPGLQKLFNVRCLEGEGTVHRSLPWNSSSLLEVKKQTISRKQPVDGAIRGEEYLCFGGKRFHIKHLNFLPAWVSPSAAMILPERISRILWTKHCFAYLGKKWISLFFLIYTLGFFPISLGYNFCFDFTPIKFCIKEKHWHLTACLIEVSFNVSQTDWFWKYSSDSQVLRL